MTAFKGNIGTNDLTKLLAIAQRRTKKIKDVRYLVVDLFCGAGGTTLGFESAQSKVRGVKLAKVIACVNHDHLAIKSHWSNHRSVVHFEEDIRLLDPFGALKSLVDYYRKLYPNAKLILWASLECTNFSKAKGGLPRDADSRTLADHLFKYIEALNPDYIQIENVVEFMSWGPLDENGKPVSKKNGTDWLRWRSEVCAHGYHDDWKEMNAADFGALTSRNRLFGCFAKRGLKTIWPRPTHAKNPQKAGLFEPLKKWRAVKEALDFSDEGTTIFNRDLIGKKKLSTKTMQRLFMGCVKHIAGGKQNFISRYYSDGGNHASIDGPLPAITTVNHDALVKAAFIAKAYAGDPSHQSKSINDPAGTLTTIPNQQSIVQAFIVKGHSSHSGKSVNAGASIDLPFPTITTQDRVRLAGVTFLSNYNGVNGGKHDNSHSIESPAGSVTTGDRHSKVTAFITKYNGNRKNTGGNSGKSIEEPSVTIGTQNSPALVTTDFLQLYYSNGGTDSSIESPAGAIVTKDRIAKVHAEEFILNPSWGGNSGSIEDPCYVVVARQDKAPLYLITCKRGGPISVPVYEGDCEWTIKLKEFMVLFDIVDIKMRMLKVSELKVIQGFPVDYVLCGNQSEQKKWRGNSVEKNVPKCWIEAYEEEELLMAAA